MPLYCTPPDFRADGGQVSERIAITGSGAIACGIGAVAALNGHEVLLLARSAESAERALARIKVLGERSRQGFVLDGVTAATHAAAAGDCTFVIEAIAED